MTFFAFGLNHNTAPVPVREAFALSDESLRELYSSLRPTFTSELLVLSTCNRTEVYVFGNAIDALTVRGALSARAGLAWPEEQSFEYDDEQAVLHVLRVAAGVTSQVLGDAQILSQMKEAYRLAVEADRVGTVLHRLLHTAFRAAKRVRSETALSEGAASVSSVAVHAARMHFERSTGAGLDARHVLLVGLGQMGIAALRVLRSLGVRHVSLTNRSRERAEEVALEFGAAVVDWEDRHAAAAKADLVLVASGAPEPIIHAADLPPRDGHPALVVDVALPRNVEPGVAGRPGYELVDLDALNRWRAATVSQRTAALPEAEEICRAELAEFVSWVMHHEALQPALHALRDTFEAIRQQAIDQHAHRFSDLDRLEVDRLTRSILQKLLAVPIVRLKANDPESLDFVRGVKFLSHVFSRPGCEDASAAGRPDVLLSAEEATPDDLESPHAARDAR